MLTVCCVLKSGGGVYDAEWVRKLRDAVTRNLERKPRFVCLSDVDVPCERIPLEHDWTGWWSKIELFREGVVNGPTLYLDLDTVITGQLDMAALVHHGPDFAMLQNFWAEDMLGSGVMWFSGDNVPHKVYTKFAKQPDAYIAHYQRNKDGPYVGDQAFISDVVGYEIPRINEYLEGIRSYKMHCKSVLPDDARIVCFHGKPRPSEVDAAWMKEHWC